MVGQIFNDTGHYLTGSQHQSTSTTATEERLQPWKALQEVQALFKPEMPGALDGNAESGADAGSQMNESGEEPLRFHLARHVINTPSTNIANVEV